MVTLCAAIDLPSVQARACGLSLVSELLCLWRHCYNISLANVDKMPALHIVSNLVHKCADTVRQLAITAADLPSSNLTKYFAPVYAFVEEGIAQVRFVCHRAQARVACS